MDTVTMQLLFFIFLILLVLLAIPSIYLHYRFLSILKERYSEKWNELGRPTLIKNNSIKNNIAVLKFLKNRDYLTMGDKQLTNIAILLWTFAYIYIVVFVITLVSCYISFLSVL